jgi:hypothetical protein
MEVADVDDSRVDHNGHFVFVARTTKRTTGDDDDDDARGCDSGRNWRCTQSGNLNLLYMEMADDNDRRQETTTTTSAHVDRVGHLLCSTNDDEDDRRRRRRRRAGLRQSHFVILWSWRTTTRTKAILWRVNINLENTSILVKFVHKSTRTTSKLCFSIVVARTTTRTKGDDDDDDAHIERRLSHIFVNFLVDVSDSKEKVMVS